MKRSPLPWPLMGIVAGTATAYILLGLFRHWHFGTSYDLGIFDQAVWHMSRFEAPASSLSGHANILGDHFSPILALFAPLYWLAPKPETLIVAQAVLLATSIIPVCLFARDRLPQWAALALSAAYALFWGMQRTAFTDVHELAFAPLLIATALVSIDRRNWRMLWAASVLLMLVKEDLIPVVASFGAYLFVVLGERRRGFWMAAAGVLAFIGVMCLIPMFNDGGGWTTGDAFRVVRERPWIAPLLLFEPPAKTYTILMWLAPFVFLPIASPLGLLLLPIGAERLLSTKISHWSLGAHYSAPLAPILAIAAADGLTRIGRRLPSGRRPMAIISVAALSVLASALLPGHQPLWLLMHSRHYQDHRTQRTGEEALAAIPSTASVVAQAALTPHLSQRDNLWVLQPGAPAADYVIGSTDLAPWPSETPQEITQLLDERRAQGYVPVFEQNGWLVLRAPNAGRAPGAR